MDKLPGGMVMPFEDSPWREGTGERKDRDSGEMIRPEDEFYSGLAQSRSKEIIDDELVSAVGFTMEEIKEMSTPQIKEIVQKLKKRLKSEYSDDTYALERAIKLLRYEKDEDLSDDEDITEWMRQDDDIAAGTEEGSGTRMGPKMPSFSEGVPEGVRPEDFANPTLQNVSDDRLDRLFNDPTFRAMIKEKLKGL